MIGRARITADDAERVFAEALAQFESGRFDEAAATCASLQASFPKNAGVLHLYGLVQLRRGQHSEARAKLERAIALSPDDPELRANLAAMLAETGHPGPAIDHFKHAQRLRPNEARIVHGLVLALRAAGRLPEAATVLAESAQRHPKNLALLRQRGEVEAILGRTAIAADSFAAALDETPDDPGLLADLGGSLLRQGFAEAALRAFERWAKLEPSAVAAHDAVGLALQRLRRWDEAVHAHFRAIAIAPRAGNVLLNLGAALNEGGKLAEAEAVLRKAAGIPEVAADALANLGNLRIRHHGDIAGAAPLYREALAHAPRHRAARIGAGIVAIAEGDYRRGFALMEARHDADAFGEATPTRRFGTPRWNGEHSVGRRILVVPEGDDRDTIQFLRFAPMLAARGAHPLLIVPSRFRPLLEPLVRRGVEICDEATAIPPHDFHCPVMSLPALLGIDSPAAAGIAPYLAALPDRIEPWRARFAGAPEPLVLVEYHPATRAHLEPVLAAIHGVRIVDIGSLDLEASDFESRAATLSACDLLITHDGAAAHLAGALGRTVWCLIPHAPEWRWLMPGDSSPWYASMRIFRCPSPVGWSSVAAAVAGALSAFAENHKGKS
jgi:Flp pilus assembly protein TadD